MKITLIGPVYPYRGGIAHFTTLLAQKLRENGHEVQIISFKKQYPQWLYPGESDKDYSETREKVDADFVITPFNPLTWNKTIKLINNHCPDKVIIPWWVTFWGPCFRFILSHLKRQGIVTVGLIHNVVPHEAKVLDHWITKWALEQADHFVVMTNKEKARLQEILTKVKRIDVVPHPIYQQFVPTGKDRAEIQKDLGLPKGKKYVLFFGFVRPYKGLMDLIDSFKLVNEKDRNIHLIVAGEFWGDRNQYVQRIQELGIQNIVHLFEKYIPDDEAAQFFEVSDLFVAPYTGGTQSGAAKMALGFGLPIVITDVIIDELLAGLPERCTIVPAKSPKGLAIAVINNISQPNLDPDEITTLIQKSWDSLINAIIRSTK